MLSCSFISFFVVFTIIICIFLLSEVSQLTAFHSSWRIHDLVSLLPFLSSVHCKRSLVQAITFQSHGLAPFLPFLSCVQPHPFLRLLTVYHSFTCIREHSFSSPKRLWLFNPPTDCLSIVYTHLWTCLSSFLIPCWASPFMHQVITFQFSCQNPLLSATITFLSFCFSLFLVAWTRL